MKMDSMNTMKFVGLLLFRLYKTRVPFFFFLILFILGGCASSVKLKNENLSAQFSYSGDYLAPQVTAFQFADDSLRILFSIPDKGLLFKNTGDKYMALLNLEYAFYSSYSSSQIVDSGSVNFQVESPAENAPFSGAVDVKFIAESRLILKLVFRDVHRNTEAQRHIPLKGVKVISQQRVLFSDSTGNPVFENYVSGSGKLKLDPGSLSFDSFWVRCYFKEYPLAILPFRVVDDPVFEMRSDSVFKLYRSDLNELVLRKNGIYFFQSDTSGIEGFTVSRFDADFPKVTRAEQLIESTRYITTRKEYLQLMNEADKKAALDRFWLEIGGQPERARNLIRSYYNRVQEANRLFSSYLEGWKTDRGMIHMIFGKPQSVYRNAETEQWTYSNIPGFPDMLFLFRKMNNPFTENDYALIRQPLYENVWYIAVDQWRQGRIVNEN
jgi:GWxTD domain-containing protein